ICLHDCPCTWFCCKATLPPCQVSRILLYKQDEPVLMPNYEFYMNWRKFEPDGEFIEIILERWNENFELLEDNHDYIQWLFPTLEQEKNLISYKMMLKFFSVKLVGEDEEDMKVTEVERTENLVERFDNLTINTHNNLRITRVLLSLGELGAEEYQAPLGKFLLKEILIEHNLPRMKESAMNFFVPAVRDVQKRQDLLYFTWRHYQPKEEFIWGRQEEFERYKAPSTMIVPLLPAPHSEWTPVYSEKKKKCLSEEPGEYGEDEWFQLASNQTVLPVTKAPEIVKALHASTHGGREMMEQQLEPHFYVPGLSVICKAVAQQCVTCAKNNPRTGPS
uniref:Uncharacterized protein n=1 Tax=Leptobrachium leishanense TaxID=445787 RepID=A0A8C5PGK0_9ANUR